MLYSSCLVLSLVCLPAQTPTSAPKMTLPVGAQPEAHVQSYPINLPTALSLSHANPLDIALASQRLEAAQAQLSRANTLWLPTIYLGADYFRHDGQLQDIVGSVFTTSRSAFMVGAGPSAVFSVSDALFSPLAARQVVRARQAEQQAAVNDSTYAVAESYFNVQQARGELAAALDTVRRADEVLRRTEQLTSGLAPKVELNRVRTEASRRRLGVANARERWETSSAELARLLRLPATSLVLPLEDPAIQVCLVDLNKSVDDLVAIGLGNRPELASRQALVQATLTKLKQEKLRPLVPSVLLRGNATNPAGTLSTGYFGGGINDQVGNFSARNSMDVQLLCELQNLGLGNRAAVRERKAENEIALIELFRTQDRVAAEVVQAHAQAHRAAQRIKDAEFEVTDAVETVEKNIEGLSQTRRVGEVIVLVFRPQEVVAAVQALDQAYRDYYGAVADFNRAQFRLYRALGHPAQCLSVDTPTP